MTGPMEMPAGELSQAGAVVDRAIEYLVGQHVGELTVASALLGGALGLLGRTMDDAAIVKVLESAIASVRSGELRQQAGARRP
jgi:hypothetical protein